MSVSRGPFAIALLVVLVLSLAANFVVVGFVASRVGEFRLTGMQRIVALGVKNYPIGDPQRDRGRKRPPMPQSLGAALADFNAARQRAFTAMRAEPFDPARLDAEFADVRAKTELLQRLGHEVIAKAVAAADPGRARPHQAAEAVLKFRKTSDRCAPVRASRPRAARPARARPRAVW